jgi:NAD(P)-dependent dehydrogenase (short-subunit alcohol dehydrogenase family)
VEAYVQTAVREFGGIDGFFNNAGVEGVVAPMTSYPTDVFDQVVAVNLRGVFLGLKHVMAVMSQAGRGSIVNTASVAGLVGTAGIAPYVATKHAVVGITRVAALEGAPAGVRVNAVCPGPVESRMMGTLEEGFISLAGAPDRAAARATITGMIPGGRYAQASEVADVVAYLLSDRSSYISGAAIPVDWALTSQ